MKPKIIGTGLSGLVGSRIRELLSENYNFVDFSLETGIDILDKKGLRAAFEENKDAQAVLHLAAFTDTNAAWEQKGDRSSACFKINVEGTENVAKFCEEYQKYLIYFSTDFVFDGTKKEAYAEDDKVSPIEWYGRTKRMGEEIVEKSKIPTAITRIAFPFRAEFKPKKDIVRKIIDGFKKDSLYPMFADQIITPTFIDDIAKGVEVFLEKKPVGTFHLVGSSFCSPYQLAIEIAEIFGFDKDKVEKGSLEEYQKSLPSNSRPWQKFLNLSNRKVSRLGIKMHTLKQALLEIKKQRSR